MDFPLQGIHDPRLWPLRAPRRRPRGVLREEGLLVRGSGQKITHQNSQRLNFVGKSPKSIGKCHWKSTMISGVSISGVRSFAPYRRTGRSRSPPWRSWPQASAWPAGTSSRPTARARSSALGTKTNRSNKHLIKHIIKHTTMLQATRFSALGTPTPSSALSRARSPCCSPSTRCSARVQTRPRRNGGAPSGPSPTEGSVTRRCF